MKKNISIMIAIIIVFLIIITYNLVYHKGQKDQLTDQNNNISEENDITSYEENVANETTENTEKNNTLDTNSKEVGIEENETKIIAQVAPSGFMGSSSYKVALYSNKEVYVITYDGNGYEEQNIISKELIAKNVESIYNADDEEHYGEVIIKGGEKINTNFGWVSFE